MSNRHRPWTAVNYSMGQSAVFDNNPDGPPNRIAACCTPEHARLIAAAPDLLAACEALLTCTERDRIDNVFVTEARAAVAKARDL